MTDNGEYVTIEREHLRALLDAAHLADGAGLLGSCRDDPSPYCRWCWAMEAADTELDDGPDA